MAVLPSLNCPVGQVHTSPEAINMIAVGRYEYGHGLALLSTDVGTVREFRSVDEAKEYIVRMGGHLIGWNVVHIGGPLT